VLDSELETRDYMGREEVTLLLDRQLSSLRRDDASKRPGVISHAGEDITSTLSAMIDQALLTYSKDVIARADFALASAGGQIVPSQTTPTLVLDRPRLWRSVLLGKSKVTGRNALTLLWGENSPGICWPFEGSKGQVGIAFATRVKVTDVTIDHVARELVSRTSSGSAPKDVEVVSCREPRGFKPSLSLTSRS
jgi:hypothetical protein